MNRPYRIESELEPGERLLWAGRPRTGVVFRSSDLFAVPFSLVWCGFAVFWEWSVVADGAPLFFQLWGIPFVLAGLYLVFGRFLVDAKLREATRYALTDRRVMISSGLWSRTLRSLPLTTLSEIAIREGRNGFGTITLGSNTPRPPPHFGARWSGWNQSVVPALDLIRDARTVERQLREAQRARYHANP